MAVDDPTVEHAGEPLTRSHRYRSASGKLIIGGALAAGVVIVMVVSNLLPDKKPEAEKPAGNVSGINLPFQAPPAPKALPPPLPVSMPAPPPIPAITPVVRPTPVDTKALKAPIFSYTAGGAAASEAKEHQVAAKAGSVDGVDDALAADLKPSDIGGTVKASRMKHPEMTIPAGTLIHCSLQTAINSQLRGFVTCLTSEEVRSATGTVTLMSRGTKLFGEIRSGLRNGQDRVMILWVKALTPDYVEIALNSPAADELGRAGAEGQVNNFFWKKFGAALLFSVIDYGPALIQSAMQKGGNGNTYTNFYSPQQQVANTILNETLQIPPVLEKNQGESVSVFVARNISFEGVYDLVVRR